MKFTLHDRVSAEIGDWCRRYLPDDAFASCIAHGARHVAMAEKLRDIGVEPGIPDWMVLFDERTFWAEIKTGTGTLSTAQRRTRERLKDAGARMGVVHCLADFIALVVAWGIPILPEPRRDDFEDDLPEF